MPAAHVADDDMRQERVAKTRKRHHELVSNSKVLIADFKFPGCPVRRDRYGRWEVSAPAVFSVLRHVGV